MSSPSFPRKKDDGEDDIYFIIEKNINARVGIKYINKNYLGKNNRREKRLAMEIIRLLAFQFFPAWFYNQCKVW